MTATRELELGTEKIRARVENGIGWVVFDDPARHNALSIDMQAAVPEILQDFQADPEVGVIVMTGGGEKAFVSGANIAEFGEKRTTSEARSEYNATMARASSAWDDVDKPVIAMIRGYCMGGGLLLAMKADIRIASDNSQFAVPAAKLGVGYGYNSVLPLLALVGPSWASEILFSARRLNADEAARIGLINRVVPVADLEAEVQSLAATIAVNAPITIKACKLAIREAMRAPEDRDLSVVNALVEACFQSDDYKEGQRAFLEKRPPQFHGR